MAKSKNLRLKGEGCKPASKCFNVTAPNDVSLCSQRSDSIADVTVPLFDLEQISAFKDEDVERTMGAVGPKSFFRLNSLYKKPQFPADDVSDVAVVAGLSPPPSPNQVGRFSPKIGKCYSLQMIDDDGNEVGSIKIERDGETQEEAIEAALDATRHSIFSGLLDEDDHANNNEDLNKVRRVRQLAAYFESPISPTLPFFFRISFCSPKSSRAPAKRLA